MRWLILFILLFVSLPLCAQQRCNMPDSSYWVCADPSRLCHVYPESTVTVLMEAKNLTFTAVYFEQVQGKYGWAGANDSLGNVLIIRTIDSGKNWLPVMMPILPKDDAVERIQLVGNLFVYVLMKSGRILRSHDWGCTYNKMSTPVAGTNCEQGKKLFEESIRHFEGAAK